jgi:hypothetical protein
VVGSVTYNLPFHASGGYKYAVEGWQFNTVVQFFNGLPFSVTAASPGDGLVNRASYAPGYNQSNAVLSHRTIHEWFNTAAFVAPAAGTWGDTGRNILKGPGTKNVDFSVFKNFKLDEYKSLQIRAEFFNLFNNVEFNNPAAAVNSPITFGTISSSASPQTFQRIARQIQLAAKFYF